MLEKHIKNNTLTITVKPNSSKNKIINYCYNRKALIVEIKAPPENNKANIEVIKFFSKLTKKQVKIVSGLSSKKKLLKFY